MKNNAKNITGETYGYLTALERIPSYTKGKRRVTPWKFKCICGNIVIRESADVKSGGIKSCGCKMRELISNSRSKPEGIAASNSLYKSYMVNCAEERGYEFNLSKDEFLKITKQNCFYCNKEPSQIKKSKTSQYIYNGIDRVNNCKGYIKSNVVACCRECNALKSGISKEMVFKLYEWFKNET
jgi:hypothetical protein